MQFRIRQTFSDIWMQPLTGQKIKLLWEICKLRQKELSRYPPPEEFWKFKYEPSVYYKDFGFCII